MCKGKGPKVDSDRYASNASSAPSGLSGRLDKQENKMHDSELWQAHQGDKSSVERLITNVQKEVSDLRTDFDGVKSTQDRNIGQKDISKEVLKWAVGILGTMLVFIFTKGA